MQTVNFWYKFHLHGYKVAVICLLLCATFNKSNAQIRGGVINLANFDEQKIHYGILIGGLSSRFRLTYSDDFTSPALDSVHSILPVHSSGFKIGFITNFHLFQYLDLRIAPTFGFYQLGLDYRLNNGEVVTELHDPTYFELPLLFKYKSFRRQNKGIYIIGGITPSAKVSGRKEEEDLEEVLLMNTFNLAFELGVGLDLFKELFKFSPEFRYSFGLTNALSSVPNQFSAGIEKLTIHSFTIYITFEGGPSTTRRKKK